MIDIPAEATKKVRPSKAITIATAVSSACKNNIAAKPHIIIQSKVRIKPNTATRVLNFIFILSAQLVSPEWREKLTGYSDIPPFLTQFLD